MDEDREAWVCHCTLADDFVQDPTRPAHTIERVPGTEQDGGNVYVCYSVNQTDRIVTVERIRTLPGEPTLDLGRIR